MTSITPFELGAATPTLVYVTSLLLLGWVIWLSYLVARLWLQRRQHQKALEGELSDAPTEAAGQPDQATAEDTLGMGVAPVLAGLFNHPSTKEPYTVALSGGWGTGKSSIMKQVEQLLSKSSPGFKAISINVWHFQSEDYLLTGFLRRILICCNDVDFRWRRIKHNLRKLGIVRTLFRTWLLGMAAPVLLFGGLAIGRGLGRYLQHTSGWLHDGGSPVYQFFASIRHTAFGELLASLFHPAFYVIRHLGSAFAQRNSSTPSWHDMVPELAVVLAVIPVVGSVIVALKQLPGLIRPVLQLIPYQQQYEATQGEAGFRQRYQDDFRNIIKHAKNKTLIIFVDDIDRISGPRVLELLETLNFIVACAQAGTADGAQGAKLYFLLAMNVPEVVRVLGTALDPQNQLPSDEARRRLAANYLAKLVDLTVSVPSLQGRDISSLQQLATTSTQST